MSDEKGKRMEEKTLATTSETKSNRIPTIAAFNPTGGVTFDSWKLAFEAELAIIGVNDNQLKKQMLLIKMSGDAMNIACSIINDDEEMEYETVIKHLMRYYAPKKSKPILMGEWMNAEMLQNQTLQQFRAALEHKLQEIDPKWKRKDPTRYDFFLMTRFITGLPRDIKNAVQLKTPSTMEEAEVAAQQFLDAKALQQQQGVKDARDEINAFRSQQFVSRRYQQSNKGHRPRLQQSKSNAKTCFICKRKGKYATHPWQECPDYDPNYKNRNHNIHEVEDLNE